SAIGSLRAVLIKDIKQHKFSTGTRSWFPGHLGCSLIIREAAAEIERLCIYLLRVYLWIARHDINLLKRRIRWHSSLTTVEIGLSDKGQHARAARKNNERKRKDMRSAKLSVPQSNLVRIAERSAVYRRNQHDCGRVQGACDQDTAMALSFPNQSRFYDATR